MGQGWRGRGGSVERRAKVGGGLGVGGAGRPTVSSSPDLGILRARVLLMGACRPTGLS